MSSDALHTAVSWRCTGRLRPVTVTDRQALAWPACNRPNAWLSNRCCKKRQPAGFHRGDLPAVFGTGGQLSRNSDRSGSNPILRMIALQRGGSAPATLPAEQAWRFRERGSILLSFGWMCAAAVWSHRFNIKCRDEGRFSAIRSRRVRCMAHPAEERRKPMKQRA